MKQNKHIQGILVGVQKCFISRRLSLDPRLTGTYYNCLLWMRRHSREKKKQLQNATHRALWKQAVSYLFVIVWAVISLKKRQLAVSRCWLIIRLELMKSWILSCDRYKSSCEQSQRVTRCLIMSSYTTYYRLHHVFSACIYNFGESTQYNS